MALFSATCGLRVRHARLFILRGLSPKRVGPLFSSLIMNNTTPHRPDDIETLARNWLRSNIRELGLIPKNTSKYHTSFVSAAPRVHPVLGMAIAPPPCSGKVVHVDDYFSIVKTDRAKFAIVDNDVLEAPLSQHSEVSITPYTPRDFDGIGLNQPSKEDQASYDSTNSRVMQIGMRRISIPLAPKSDYMRNTFDLLCQMPMPDGVRVLANALIDAGARRESLSLVEDESRYSLSMQLQGSKFTGAFTLGYAAGKDLYWVELTTADKTERIEDIYFDDLPELLDTHVSDDQCLKARVVVTKPARPTKSLAA